MWTLIPSFILAPWIPQISGDITTNSKNFHWILIRDVRICVKRKSSNKTDLEFYIIFFKPPMCVSWRLQNEQESFLF
jgi:hypothetical protein